MDIMNINIVTKDTSLHILKHFLNKVQNVMFFRNVTFILKKKLI